MYMQTTCVARTLRPYTKRINIYDNIGIKFNILLLLPTYNTIIVHTAVAFSTRAARNGVGGECAN